MLMLKWKPTTMMVIREGHVDGRNEQQFQMTEAAWDCIEKAIRNVMVENRNRNEAEMTLPCPDSAPIAGYNPHAHVMFQAEQARSSVDELDDALMKCKLRSRPVSWNAPVDKPHSHTPRLSTSRLDKRRGLTWMVTALQCVAI
jgi:hypothetical protein